MYATCIRAYAYGHWGPAPLGDAAAVTAAAGRAGGPSHLSFSTYTNILVYQCTQRAYCSWGFPHSRKRRPRALAPISTVQRRLAPRIWNAPAEGAALMPQGSPACLRRRGRPHAGAARGLSAPVIRTLRCSIAGVLCTRPASCTHAYCSLCQLRLARRASCIGRLLSWLLDQLAVLVFCSPIRSCAQSRGAGFRVTFAGWLS
jgi:hypothetical protein